MVIISDTAKFIEIKTTFEKHEDAKHFACKILEARLVTCTKIQAVESSYPWEGKIQNSTEFQLCMITKRGLMKKVEAFIKTNHPYKVPQIVAVPIVYASKDYAKWINGSVAKK